MACSNCKNKKHKPIKGKSPGTRTYTLNPEDHNLDVNPEIKRLSVFHRGALIDFMNFKKLCAQYNITDADIEDYLALREKEISEGIMEFENHLLNDFVEEMNKIPVCPQCGYNIEVVRVNTMPCNQVGGKYTVLMQCNNMECGWEKYSRSTNIEDFIRRNRRFMGVSMVVTQEIKEY